MLAILLNLLLLIRSWIVKPHYGITGSGWKSILLVPRFSPRPSQHRFSSSNLILSDCLYNFFNQFECPGMISFVDSKRTRKYIATKCIDSWFKYRYASKMSLWIDSTTLKQLDDQTGINVSAFNVPVHLPPETDGVMFARRSNATVCSLRRNQLLLLLSRSMAILNHRVQVKAYPSRQQQGWRGFYGRLTTLLILVLQSDTESIGCMCVFGTQAHIKYTASSVLFLTTVNISGCKGCFSLFSLTNSHPPFVRSTHGKRCCACALPRPQQSCTQEYLAANGSSNATHHLSFIWVLEMHLNDRKI